MPTKAEPFKAYVRSVTDDGEVKDELKTKYAAEFDAYTQEEKEKLSVADMTQEEYVVWRANQLYDQEVAKQADTDTTSFVNKQISSDEETKLAVKEAAASAFAVRVLNTVPVIASNAS